MTEKAIISEILTTKGITRKHLAEQVGYKNPSEITHLLGRTTGLKTDILSKLLNALDYSLVAVSNDGKTIYNIGENNPTLNTVSNEDLKLLNALKSIAKELNTDDVNALRTLRNAYTSSNSNDLVGY